MEKEKNIFDFDSFLKKLDDEEWVDQLSGGKADNKLPSDFDIDDLSNGAEIEMEHTDNPTQAVEIAMDHLEEHPMYYDDEVGLPNMERELGELEKLKDDKNIIKKFKDFK